MLYGVWPSQWRLLDEEVHLVLIFVVEWRDADQHFVNQNSECPPVQGVIVARSNDHLGRNVFRGADEGVGFKFVVSLVNFSKAEVSEEDVPIHSDKDVLWLQITIVNFRFMKVAQRKSYLCCVESHPVFAEASLFRKMLEKFTSLDERHHEIDVCLFDENVLHGNYEGVLDLKHDELLVAKTLKRVVLDDSVFPYTLHGIGLAVLLILDEVYFSESALPDEPLLFEVIKRISRHVILFTWHLLPGKDHLHVHFG